MKTCLKCKWCEAITIGDEDFSRCRKTKELSPVTGELGYSKYKYCSVERNSGWMISFLLGACGKSGRYWQEKQPGEKPNATVDSVQRGGRGSILHIVPRDNGKLD